MTSKSGFFPNDFDDFGIRISVTDGPPMVPEPSMFVLLGSSLFGLGLAARKLPDEPFEPAFDDFKPF